MSTDDDDNNDDGGDPDEPRARDIVADPAQLERWFGLPSFTELEEAGVEIEGDAAGDLPQNLEAVDPELVEHLERQGRDWATGSAVIFDLELVRQPPHFGAIDPWFTAKAEQVVEGREYELPPELQEAMAVNVPQAILRDLHRVETEFSVQFEVPPELQEHLDDDPSSAARELIRTDFRHQLTELTGFAAARRALQAMATAIASPWGELDLTRSEPEIDPWTGEVRVSQPADAGAAGGMYFSAATSTGPSDSPEPYDDE